MSNSQNQQNEQETEQKEPSQSSAPTLNESPTAALMAEKPTKRSGKTREHYLQQKSQQFAHFRINTADLPKLESMQFNIYDFISASFAFSQPKKELAIGVLNSLKSGPKPFSQLEKELSAKKSSLFLVCLSLERAGLIERKAKGEPYSLSTSFSNTIIAYANWWKSWAQH